MDRLKQLLKEYYQTERMAKEEDLEALADALLSHNNELGRRIIVNEYINFAVGEQFGIFLEDEKIKNVLMSFLQTYFLENQVDILANLTRRTPRQYVMLFEINGKKIKLDATYLKRYWKKYLIDKFRTDEQKTLKNAIKLTESDLHNIVKRCINEIIKQVI